MTDNEINCKLAAYEYRIRQDIEYMQKLVMMHTSTNIDEKGAKLLHRAVHELEMNCMAAKTAINAYYKVDYTWSKKNESK